jgi:hypothetical protein
MIRCRTRRHLGSLLGMQSLADRSAKAALAARLLPGQKAHIPPELTPHEYAILLLHVAAEVEHALMVQYLYAGFSLGGARVPEAHRQAVAQWQEILLGIAKEEMGHLMTVQNLLRCLGGPLNLDREDFPWDSEFYPFPFQLEPLTRRSLAKYVYVESPDPEKWTGEEADAIRALAHETPRGMPLHRIGVLYDLIEQLLADPSLVKDRDFRGSTYPYQASWDEWARGYKAGDRGSAAGGAMKGTPDVILWQISSRSDALSAIKAIASQGEANPTADDGQPSHFARFLRIFRHFPKDGDWQPTRNVPINPVVASNLGDPKNPADWPGTPILHPQAQLWAHLFNVRYQALLHNLLHAFDYPGNLSETSQMTPRGLLVHATFGEMYNIRALSQILVQTPLEARNSRRMAGPPFQMPYTVRLPFDAADRWRIYFDLLAASATLTDRLLGHTGAHEKYLLGLREADRETMRMIDAIQAGLSVSMRSLQRYN